MKKQSLKSFFYLLTSSLVFTACSSDMNLDEGVNKSEQKNINSINSVQEIYSGKELFKSIFFAYGDFAKKIPMYKESIELMNRSSKEQLDLFDNRFDLFAEQIERQKPSFFDDFKRDIESKDHLVIEKALKYGSLMIYNNVDVLFPELSVVLTKLDDDPEVSRIINKEGDLTEEDIQFVSDKADEMMQVLSPCGPTVCVAYFALAIHNTVGLTMNVGVYLAIKWWGPKLDSPKKSKIIDNPHSNLQFEMFVNEIAMAQ